MRYLFVLCLLFPLISFAGSCENAKLSHLLGAAVALKDIQAVKFAIELGANPNGLTESESIRCFNGMPSYPVVMLALAYEDLSILEYLLKNGASVNAGCCGSTAIGEAQSMEDKRAYNLLIEYGVNSE